jgi:enoyl-CoA hydratase/carnithine racemase
MLFQSARLQLECVDRVATLSITSPGNGKNVVSLAFLGEFEQALRVVEERPFISVLVVRSACPGVFLTGPTAHEVERVQTDGERYSFADLGQRILARFERLSTTTLSIAFIEGLCTNAGLELALACDYRLAVARPETLLGIDALARGLFPCWGATQRLPKLLGPDRALDLLVNGRMLPARAAHRIGLVDHAFGPRPAKTELWSFIADLQDRPCGPYPRRSRRTWRQRAIEESLLCNPFIFRPWKRRIVRPAEHYLVTAVERGWRSGPAAGLATERAAFRAACADRQQRERRAAARRWDSLRANAAGAPKLAHIGIAGATPLGINLALLAMRFGASVCLLEGDARLREQGLGRLRLGLTRDVQQGWFTIVEAEQKQKALRVVSEINKLSACQAVFAAGAGESQGVNLPALDAGLPEHVILAAVSSAPASLMRRLQFPQRFVALRWLDAPLDGRHVQIALTTLTTDATLARIVRWLDGCGKWVVRAAPISVPDSAVFAA